MQPTVLVFGGTGALGSEICRVLKQEGAELAFTYHSQEEKAVVLARELQIPLVLRCDLNHFADVDGAMAKAQTKLGPLTAIVQAAGVSGDGAFYQAKTGDGTRLQNVGCEEFDAVMGVNARGSFAVCRAAYGALKDRGGNVVFIGAMDGVKPVPSPVHFAMSKAAMKGLVEAAAKEGGPSDIRVNLIAPGILSGGAASQIGEELAKSYLKHCGLKRFGTMREAADLAAWFALKNTYVTGQCVLLDGGL